MAEVAPARAAAWAALLAVERGVAHSDDALHAPAMEQLSRRDRDLATELTLGTLRWELVLDEQIASRLRDPSASMHLGVIVALRLGAYQLLMLDRIPAHAAVGESVELAKQADGAGAASLTNALLRRMEREAKSKPQFSPETAHPDWLKQRWQSSYGTGAALRVCQFDQAPAPTTLRLLTPDAEQQLLDMGAQLGPGNFLANARVLERGADMQALCASGAARVQDEASQLVGELAALYATLREEQAGADPPRVLDACAAPGGKTAVLLERTHTAHITALELSPRRLRGMSKRLQDPRLTLQEGDARLLSPDGYDVILCDVPCSGTGTLARNPEIRSRLREGDLATQAERQRAILDAALVALRPGGSLVYSTCSLEPEENEAVVEAAIRNRSGYELIPIVTSLNALTERGIVTTSGADLLRSTATQGPYLRTLPGTHLCDGFFSAVLTRVR